ncbi:hypothetical protein GIB67_034001 [Kingdonia uniflora]|uniref:Ubiquitin-like protease family profile domain-containing protein n=1 Tax=Kingdonia uniflora TaxID=39325 RepID=A0A7J7M636_9MAGN|nr:hypothetical protein GIB67_034001 [Kingdonia uniflora]
MKSNREVNEQFVEENQTHESGAKKGTSNANNYTSRCTGLGLHKIFAALPEEENGVLRNTCFTPLLLIDPITTMSTLVVEIFDRHLGDMKFQFGRTIIQMKPIHNEAIPQEEEYIWVEGKLKRREEDVYRLNLLKIILSFLLLNKGINIWMNLKFPRMEESIHLFPKLQGWRMTSFKRRQIVTFKKFFVNPKLLVIVMKPFETDMQQGLVQEAMSMAIGSSSSATEIRAVVVKWGTILYHFEILHSLGCTSSLLIRKLRNASEKEQVAPGEGLEVVKDFMVDDDVEVGREVNFKAISSEYGGDLLEWKKGDEKDNDDKKNVEEKVKSEEEQPQVAEEEDSDPPTVVVYYNGKKDVQHTNKTMVVAEVAKIDIVFFNQEEVVGEAYQVTYHFVNQTTVVSVEEQTLEVEKIEDEASQVTYLFFADQTTSVSVEEQTIEVAQTEVVISRQEEDIGEASQVIDVYIKTLIQYFNRQHRARPDKKRIVLADVFACQYMGRAFNVLTRNMSSPEGVKLKKKSIWEQITSLQWDGKVYNCIHRGDFKVVNSKLILIPWNINDNHRVFCVESIKARKICIYDSMVDAKIINARKKKLSPRHQLFEDQISTILPKMLIWRDFADRSSRPTGSKVKNYGLNSKWTTRFGKYPIRPNGYDCGVYMLDFMDNILRGIKFMDLIDGKECHYTITYDILRLGVEPEEI